MENLNNGTQQPLVYQQTQQPMVYPPAQQPMVYQPAMLNGPQMQPQQVQGYYTQQQLQLMQQAGPLGMPGMGQMQKRTGQDILAEQQGLYVKHQLDLLEVVSGCNMPNIYYVYPLINGKGNESVRLFKCVEKSSWCDRNCVPKNCQPFNMTIYNTLAGFDEPFLELERKCTCTCLCFSRPEMTVTYSGGQHVGKVVDPFTCFNLQNDIYDKDNIKTHTVEASCCQLGILCKAPCESCQLVDFFVKNPAGEVIATLQKQSAGCVQAAISAADNFALNFPNGATPNEKALLLASVVLIDYVFFDQKKDRNNQGLNNL